MYLGNLEIRRSRAWTGETGGQYRTPFSLTVCTHTHSPTCNLIQAFTGSAVFLRKTDSMNLPAFLMISLIFIKIKKNGWSSTKEFLRGCPCEYRLYGGEHVIDLASSVERSIHCVWPCAHVLTAYYRKRAKEKSKSASSLIFRRYLDSYLDGTDECEGREDMICFHLPSLWRYFTSWPYRRSFVRSLFYFHFLISVLSHVLYFFPFGKSPLP